MSKDTPPIMMNMPGGLTFTKNGVWLNDGAPVTNVKVALYFATRLQWSAEHDGYVVEVDGKCVSVEVEDTPFVVRTIDTSVKPWQVLLNDDTREEFRPESLVVGDDDVFYCLVKDKIQARLLRPAMQALLKHICETDSGVALVVGGEQFLVGKRT